MVVFIVAACIITLHGHWQHTRGVGWTGLQPSLGGRITYLGIFSDPNDLGQLLVVALSFCAYFLASAGAFMGTLLLACSGWLAYGIYLTDSRGTMLAALAMLAYHGHKRFGKIVTLGVGAVTVVGLVAATRFAEIDASEQSAGDRIEAWYAGTRMFLTHPIFGVGAGNFLEYHQLTAHNSIMLAMAELGIFGFVPWFGMLWYAGRMLWILDRRKSDDAREAGELEAANGLTGMAIAVCVSSFFLSQTYKHILFMPAALIVARYIHVSTHFGGLPRFSAIRELPIYGLVAIGAIFGMWATTKVLL
jgi:O-antigen ligase